MASSLTTVSARAMLEAMVAGQRDPVVQAEMAKGKIRSKILELREALDGHFTHRHARLVDVLLNRLAQVNAALLDLDDVIDKAGQPWAHQLELLQTIPGVGPKVAQTIIAETGADMRQFPTASHLAAWAGLVPGLHESAGRRRPVGVRHGNKWLASAPVEAAAEVARTKDTYLAAQHARITSRRGRQRARIAVAHSILVSAFYMLRRDEAHRDLGPDWLHKHNDEAHARRLVAQLERLGHTVTVDTSVARPAVGPWFATSPPAPAGALAHALDSPIHGGLCRFATLGSRRWAMRIR